jgi:hypothetical protein
MPANVKKLMSEVPRGLEIAARHPDPPLHRQPTRRKEVAQRVEPLLGALANGEIPLDDHLARAFAAYVEEHHARSH